MSSEDKCVVLVPVWKQALSNDEVRSLAQLKGVLGGRHPISFIAPQSLDIEGYRRLWGKIDVNDAPFPNVERFADGNFMDKVTYSHMLVTKDFYQRFLGRYEYMLIYQLDAWVFSDRLDEWVERGYDYVGAPWCHFCGMKCREQFQETGFCVGNGGFSLRNVARMEELLTISETDDAYMSFLPEDVYISYLPGLKKPNCMEAMEFSMETNAPNLLKTMNDKLPFGMHNVQSYDAECARKLMDETFCWRDGFESMLSAGAEALENIHPKIVVSLASYPRRLDYCKRTLDSILHQTAIELVHRIYINIDDNISEEDVEKYKSLEGYSPKIKVRICPAKWKSANKLIWTYKEHHDDVIICFDDDKNYPLTAIERLLEEWNRHPDCIVAEEVNPYTVDGDGVKYIDDVDIKLKQRDFGKYLSNNCLFPPNCFSELLYDWDKFWYVTQGNHDELWFWIVSTLKGVRVIGLDWTYACYIDGIWMKDGESDLFKVNSDDSVRNRYYARMNELFGEDMKKVMMERPVQIDFNCENKVAVLRSLREINDHFRIFPVEFKVDPNLRKSWVWKLGHALQDYNWYGCRIK